MPLTLFYSFPSPFVRKVLVCASEAEVPTPITTRRAVVSPIKRDTAVAACNPLGKVPTLVLDDGTALYDSTVICEYLNAIGDGSLLPSSGPARWRTLREQSLADGLLDAALVARHEIASRPTAYQWEGAVVAQHEKIVAALDVIDAESVTYGARVDVGTIATACALAYLDYRFPELAWRTGRDRAAAWHATFARRASMVATSVAR